MQPHEFHDLIDGYTWRKEQQENVLAYFVTSLMNVEGKSLKKAITPKELLRPMRTQAEKRNKAEDRKHIIEKFKLDGGEK